MKPDPKEEPQEDKEVETSEDKPHFVLEVQDSTVSSKTLITLTKEN